MCFATMLTPVIAFGKTDFNVNEKPKLPEAKLYCLTAKIHVLGSFLFVSSFLSINSESNIRAIVNKV